MQKVVAAAAWIQSASLFCQTPDVFIYGLPGYAKGLDAVLPRHAVTFHIIEDKLTYVFASFRMPAI